MRTNNMLIKNLVLAFCLVVSTSLTLRSVAQAETAKTESVDSRLDKLEDRLLEVEIQKQLNKVAFSGTFVNRFEYYNSKHSVPGTPAVSDTLKLFSTYFALNIDATVTDKITLYSTVAMSKFWNQDGRNEAPGYWSASEQGSFAYKGSTPMFDRAYMTYRFDIPMTFSIGRMSTNNGLPANQLDGFPRQGTYPRFSFNAIFDGAALTYDFSSLLPKDHTLNVRAFYTPYMNVSSTDRTKQIQDNGVKVESNTPMYSILTEYSLSNTSFFGKMNISHMLNDYRNFYWDGFNNPNDHTNATPNNPYYEGGFNMFYLGFEDIGHIGLNVSGSSLLYWARLLDPSSETKNSYSSAYLINANQNIGDNWVVGGEYIKTDENFYIDEWAYLNLIPFYKTPNSKGYHAFVAHKLAQNLSTRIGYYNLKVDPCSPNSTNPFLTEEAKSDAYYVNLRLDF